MDIVDNDIYYKEIDTNEVFAKGDSKEFDAAIAKLMEKNRIQAKEISSLKIEHESQAMMLCEIIEQKKRAVEDRAMLEDDKRNLANRLEEKSTKLTRISNMQMDTLSQMMNIYHELNIKYIEILTLKLQNEQLQNELKREKEIEKNFNKSSEAIKHFKQLLKSPRSKNTTSRLGFNSTEEDETSKSAKQRSDKGKNSKPTCHYCNNKGHTADVFRSKRTNHHNTPKSQGYCYK